MSKETISKEKHDSIIWKWRVATRILLLALHKIMAENPPDADHIAAKAVAQWLDVIPDGPEVPPNNNQTPEREEP